MVHPVSSLCLRIDNGFAMWIYRTCGDVDGYPSSIARPALFQTPMFTDQQGREDFNNEAMSLPIVKV